ncbi:hypothetical protein ACOU9P_002661 [Enterococcus faecium]
MTNLYLFQSKTDETLIDKFKWIVWLYQQLFKLAGFESKLEVYGSVAKFSDKLILR